MTTEEQTFWMKKIVDASTNLDREWDAFAKSTGADTDSPLGESVWRCFDVMLNSVADLTGFSRDAISWFVYENECGHKKMSQSFPDGKMRPVKNVADFVKANQ